MTDTPKEELERLQKLVAKQDEERGRENKVVIKGQDGMGGVIVGVQDPAAPSRVLRRDGERPFFGSGIYERVSKAKKVWLEREEGSGNARVVEVGYRLKTSIEPPQRVPSPKLPRPTSAVGDWGMGIFQEIDDTITETVETVGSASCSEEDVDDEHSALDEEEDEEGGECETEVDMADENSNSVEARDML